MLFSYSALDNCLHSSSLCCADVCLAPLSIIIVDFLHICNVWEDKYHSYILAAFSAQNVSLIIPGFFQCSLIYQKWHRFSRFWALFSAPLSFGCILGKPGILNMFTWQQALKFTSITSLLLMLMFCSVTCLSVKSVKWCQFNSILVLFLLGQVRRMLWFVMLVIVCRISLPMSRVVFNWHFHDSCCYWEFLIEQMVAWLLFSSLYVERLQAMQASMLDFGYFHLL